MTNVVNLKNSPYDVFIGRPSKWGNPFSHREGTQAEFKVTSREEAINKYREWIKTQPELIESLHELKGKTLGCYCKPKKCHGDIIASMVNQLEMNEVDIL